MGRRRGQNPPKAPTLFVSMRKIKGKLGLNIKKKKFVYPTNFPAARLDPAVLVLRLSVNRFYSFIRVY